MKDALPRLSTSLGRLARFFPATAVVLVCAALAYCAPLAATAIVGQENLRAKAQDLLAQALGRPVVIEGPVRLTMLPWLGLRVGSVTVPDDPAFGPEPLMRVDSVTIGLNLRALARRSIQVESFALRAPTLRLARDAQGRENWRPAGETASGEAAPGPEWSLASLPVGVRLSGATLVFDDTFTGTRLTASRLNLATSSGEGFDFSLSCDVSASPWDIAGELAVHGQASYGATGRHLLIHKADVAGTVRLPAGADGEASRLRPTAAFSGNLLFQGQAGALEISRLVLEGLGARVTGQVNLAGLYADKPNVFATLQATASRSGAWTGLLGLIRHPADASIQARAQDTPAFRAPEQSDTLGADLVLAVSPEGWILEKLLVRDGQGRLSASGTRNPDEMRLDILAEDLDLDAWLPRDLDRLLAGQGDLAASSVRASLDARDVRLAGLEVNRALARLRGENGDLRLYPCTIQGGDSLLSADVRLRPSDTPRPFSARVELTPLTPGPGKNAGELNLSGQIASGTATGKASLRLAEPPAGWPPSPLPNDIAGLVRSLGGLSASCSFRTRLDPASPGGWEISDLDMAFGRSRIGGKLARKGSAVSLDLQADRLDADALAALAAPDGAPWAGASLPAVEGRLAAKRLTAWGLEFEDVSLAGQASPHGLKLSSLTAGLGGGKLTGTLSLEDKDDRRAASGSLAAQGVPGARLEPLLPEGWKLSGPLGLKASGEAGGRPGQAWWRGFKGQAELQMGPGQIAWPGAERHGQKALASWPVSRAALTLKAAAHVSAEGREAALADITGTVSVDAPGNVRQIQTDLKGQAGLDQTGRLLWYRQPRIEANLTVQPPFASPGRTARCQVRGKFEADLEKASFALSEADASLAGIPAHLRLAGASAGSGLALSGALDVPEFSPRDAASRLGLTIPPRAHPEAWRRAKLSAEIGGTTRDIRVNHLQVALDDSLATGQAVLAPGKSSLDLTVTSLDMDLLAPPPPEQAKAHEEPIPLETLRELSVDAKVRLGRLTKGKLVWEQNQFDFSAHQGRFSLRHQSPAFYGGNYSLFLRGDARPRELWAQLDLSASGFAADTLLQDLAGGSSLTRGTGDFRLSVESHGATDKALRRRAAGTARFLVSDGRLGFKDSQAKAPAQPPNGDRESAPPPPPTSSSDSLPFGTVGAGFSIHEGVGRTADFEMNGPDVVITKGEGWVSLVDETIDLNLLAIVKDVGSMPVRIRGPLYDPGVDIDRSKILEEKIIKLFKGVFSIPGNVLDRLKGLF